jgi:hypothetical protein
MYFFNGKLTEILETDFIKIGGNLSDQTFDCLTGHFRIDNPKILTLVPALCEGKNDLNSFFCMKKIPKPQVILFYLKYFLN